MLKVFWFIGCFCCYHVILKFFFFLLLLILLLKVLNSTAGHTELQTMSGGAESTGQDIQDMTMTTKDIKTGH